MTSLGKNQRIIDDLFNYAHRPPAHRLNREMLSLSRPHGVKGGQDARYDFGNTYSRPAVVVGRTWAFADGTPRR